jgi:hypothetical protein
MITIDFLSAALPWLATAFCVAAVVGIGWMNVLLYASGEWVAGIIITIILLAMVFIMLSGAQLYFGWDNFPIIYER